MRRDRIHLAVAVVTAALLWFFMFTKRTLERWEGLVLLLIYVSYIVYLVIA